MRSLIRALALVSSAVVLLYVAEARVDSAVRLAQGQITPAAQEPAADDAAPAELLKPGPMPELVLGKPDAPVTIVEYADLTCPHCAAFHANELPQIKQKYIDTGNARLIFREFPLNTPSLLAFMAVRCVDSDKALPLISALFSHQDDWRDSRTPDELRKNLSTVGQQVGLAPQAFDACIPAGSSGKLTLNAAQKKLAANISAVGDRAQASFNVDSTPTFFVNGKRVEGAVDLGPAIDQALKP
jgi:protein-disulfide isomerase